ncbi:hypothetical protein [Halarchaeum nitratireducens]|uniref:Uncharacterized protein n=1 Tax=Halarchaeum nitratireducens TaxID=489913 RepID=A0A830GCP5_9EURY|nr:hypothetical protein [Halarchaeum nitratireducens]GGN21575.1 hypothetical protein GCM10009021_23660 [Halarchaeum nitratireducens]
MADTATDPPMVLRRTESAVPPIRPPGFEREQSASLDRDSLSFRAEHAVLDSASEATGLTADDGAAVSAFVSGTDFDRETLFLETALVGECYRLRLCSVSWGPEEIETEYARLLRPYDERCEADRSVFESRLIRLPVSLDADAVNAFGSSIGSGTCDSRVARAEATSKGDTSTNATSDGEGGARE